MKRIVALTGAGMSAESGLKTFRDADGLWEGHDVMQVASPEGWRQDPGLVLDFYNQRRRQLFDVRPNQGHELLAGLEQRYSVDVVTQNVDDLHERAGSSRVLHLHGELLKVRSSGMSDWSSTGQPISFLATYVSWEASFDLISSGLVKRFRCWNLRQR